MKLFGRLFGLGSTGRASEEKRSRPADDSKCSFGSVQGQGKRSSQQDYFVAVNTDSPEAAEKGILLLVADGMGGLESGEEASELAANSMVDAFNSMCLKENLSLQIINAVLNTNKNVYEAFRAESGTTLALCIIHQDRLYMASVGDSSVYLLRDEQFSRLNRPQNIENLGYLLNIRKGSTDPESVEPEINKAALTHFVGMEELDDIDFFRHPMRLLPGDTLLICSDGVDGSIPADLLADCLREKKATDCCKCIDVLLKQARLAHQDNYTALVYKYGV